MASTNFQPGTVVQSSWLREVDQAVFPYLTAVTGTNTITATAAVTYTAYLQQQGGFILNPQNSNTGPVTININGLGPVAVTKYGTSPLVASDLAVGVIAYIVYDGVRFQLLNPQTVAARITGRLINTQTFTSSGTYTPTAGTSRIIVEVKGGGGQAGGCAACTPGNVSVGGGGGGGAYSRSFLTSGFSGATVTIGAGGSGAAAGANGNSGGTSSFGALVTAPGGGGGTAGALGGISAAAGGAGGVVGLGNIVASGGETGDFVLSPGTFSYGGKGAIGLYGSSAIQVATVGGTVVGNNAPTDAYGGGGSGAAGRDSGVARSGGAGAAGIVIVYEYT